MITVLIPLVLQHRHPHKSVWFPDYAPQKHPSVRHTLITHANGYCVATLYGPEDELNSILNSEHVLELVDDIPLTKIELIEYLESVYGT